MYELKAMLLTNQIRSRKRQTGIVRIKSIGDLLGELINQRICFALRSRKGHVRALRLTA